jgi:phosphoribosyl 1,2-cyclic phosphate phosphodiesterase
MMKGKVQFLGTGASVGIPMIGCDCAVCTSKDPLNKRLRPSALVMINGKRILIDAGPDLRYQMLRVGVDHLDGLIMTHAHYDHTAGFDDLRPIYYKRRSPLPVLLSQETANDVRNRYFYLFGAALGQPHIDRFDLKILPEQIGKVEFEGFPISYITYEQGGMQVNGYRIGNVAYVSDIRHFESAIFDRIRRVKTLIVSALRFTPSPLHFSIDEAIEFAKDVKAETVWLTHISHELDHCRTNAYLPPHMRLAYDGLEIEFEVP